MSMLTLVKRFSRIRYNGARVRTTFRTWAGKTDYNDNIVEFALAHQLDQKVEGAYQRSQLIERRRPLMQDWADLHIQK